MKYFYKTKFCFVLRKHIIKDIGGRSRKMHDDTSEGMYEEVDDSGRGERVV